MDRLARRPALEHGIDLALRHDRWLVAASIVGVVALAWLYLWHDAAMMAAMPAIGAPSGSAFAMAFVMWTIMMVGMMLPGAAPALLLYSAMVRKHRERGSVLPATWIFASGYLAVWTAFSLAAAALQVALEQAALLTPMLVSASLALNAAILIIAGIYQWTPAKQACLHQCRTPLQFFMTRWRGGAGGALRMGVDHGLYCLGCCWALMLLLFVAGVMNLLWVALIAAFVLMEKLLPGGKWIARLAGIGMMLAGAALLIRV